MDIVKEAGISKPTFYHHFAKKEAAIRWHATKNALAGGCLIGRYFTWYQGILGTILSASELSKLYMSFSYNDITNPFLGMSIRENFFIAQP